MAVHIPSFSNNAPSPPVQSFDIKSSAEHLHLKLALLKCHSLVRGLYITDVNPVPSSLLSRITGPSTHLKMPHESSHPDSNLPRCPAHASNPLSSMFSYGGSHRKPPRIPPPLVDVCISTSPHLHLWPHSATRPHSPKGPITVFVSSPTPRNEARGSAAYRALGPPDPYSGDSL